MNKTDDIEKKLDPLFNPRAIAVIGATNNSNKWGFSTITSAIDGFKGPVYPVNIREKEIIGSVNLVDGEEKILKNRKLVKRNL